MYFGSISFSKTLEIKDKFATGLWVFKISESSSCYLIKWKMIVDLQDAGKISDSQCFHKDKHFPKCAPSELRFVLVYY